MIIHTSALLEEGDNLTGAFRCGGRERNDGLAAFRQRSTTDDWNKVNMEEVD